MKLAVCSNGKDIDSLVADNFGRSPYFLFVEVEEGKIKKTEVLKNNYQAQSSGVGVAVAQMVVEKGADVVIAGSVGPRALDVLKQFNVQIYQTSGPIKQALKKYTQ